MKGWIVGAVGTIMLAAGVSSADAQTHAFDRGAMRIGGGGSITSTSNPSTGERASDRQTRISVSPLLEYFITPGLSVGGTLSLSRAAVAGASQTSVAVGPSLAYYFHTPERQFHPFVAAGVNVGRTSYDSGTQQTWTQNQLGYRAAGGLVFLVAPNVGLTGELFLSQFRVSAANLPVDGVTTNQFGFSAGISVFLF